MKSARDLFRASTNPGHPRGSNKPGAVHLTRGLRAGDFGVEPAGFTKGFGENPAIPCFHDQVTHKPVALEPTHVTMSGG
jgi:hypothetical protein